MTAAARTAYTRAALSLSLSACLPVYLSVCLSLSYVGFSSIEGGMFAWLVSNAEEHDLSSGH